MKVSFIIFTVHRVLAEGEGAIVIVGNFPKFRDTRVYTPLIRLILAQQKEAALSRVAGALSLLTLFSVNYRSVIF